MKLYYIPAACSLAAHILVNELALDVTLVRVDYQTHRTEDGRDFLALNPLGYVPLLELDDGSLLREGPVILQFLAGLRPHAGLMPAAGTLQHYRQLEWLSFLTSEIHKGFIPLLYPRLAGKYGTDTARPKLEQRYRWIDQQLAGRTFLAGDRFTPADAYLFALTQWGQADWLVPTYRADIHFDGLLHLRDWYMQLRVRPSVRQALEVEGLQT